MEAEKIRREFFEIVMITNLCLCFFTEMLLGAIAILNAKTRDKSLSTWLYNAVLYAVMFLLIVDLLSRCDGLALSLYPVFNGVGNFLAFLFNPICPILWFLYVHSQVYCDNSAVKRLAKYFSIWVIINTALVIMSQFNGWYYVIDALNVYHRGPLFILPVIVDQAIIISTLILLFVNRKRIEKTYFHAFIFFGVLSTLCVMLQAVFYGVAFVLNGVAVSLVIVNIQTQNRRMNVDYLTGAFNRKLLDYHIEKKIRRASETKSFSGILIDLDNFKMINDTLGHGVGDEALKTFVRLIRSCVRENDFVARYGGDEFYIILDTDNPGALSEVVRRIKDGITAFNTCGDAPYQIGLSMGYCIYDVHTQKSVETFQTQLDDLMYQNKIQNKIMRN